MTRPTLSLLVPTHREDRPLRRCLDSVRPQLERGDEVIVVGDTHDGPLPAVEALVKSYGKPYRYVAHDAGYHDFGHSQLNYGISLATGDYIHCNDDDDIWTPDALQAFRKMASHVREPVPFLFRFKSYLGPIFWMQPGLFVRNWIGGHCLLAPRQYAGQWGPEYNGDFDWLESTVNNAGGLDSAVWCEAIVAVARP